MNAELQNGLTCEFTSSRFVPPRLGRSDKATPQAEDKSHPRKPTSPGHTHWDTYTHRHTHWNKHRAGTRLTPSESFFTPSGSLSQEKLHKAADPHQWECVATVLRAHTTNAQWETKPSSYFQDNSPHPPITCPPALCCLCRRPSHLQSNQFDQVSW